MNLFVILDRMWHQDHTPGLCWWCSSVGFITSWPPSSTGVVCTWVWVESQYFTIWRYTLLEKEWLTHCLGFWKVKGENKGILVSCSQRRVRWSVSVSSIALIKRLNSCTRTAAPLCLKQPVVVVQASNRYGHLDSLLWTFIEHVRLGEDPGVNTEGIKYPIWLWELT